LSFNVFESVCFKIKSETPQQRLVRDVKFHVKRLTIDRKNSPNPDQSPK